ncbi:metal ABC transporter solute-binding protein, Zn/Mn family [Streptomyces sp. NPDC058067]|uniref:metal ABC transporter solute-binding protein, Zn/Mn family n=1 Tax=Streptomyces sp. NPDC058067 TaxID=3346324 RepID=UPI0036E23BE6
MPTPPSPLRLTLIAGAGITLLAGCGASSDAKNETSTSHGSSHKIAVTASTNVYGDITQQIGGDQVEVTSVISDPSQDPHSYEANTQNQLTLSKAKVVIENGGGYDDFIDRMLGSGNNSSAQLINAVKVSGRTTPGSELNEHVWYDFPSVAKIADRIAAALGKADPAHAATFTKNAATLKGKLAGLEAKEADIKKKHDGEAIGITEPVPLYLTEASGLVNKTPKEFSEAIEEGHDVSPKVLQETLALYSGKQVKALVHNAQTSGPQSEKVVNAAKNAHIPVVPVTETLPKGKDYLGWMTSNVDALASALDK